MVGPLLSDLDGTIADTAPAIFHSLRVTCSELGIELTAEDELSWLLGPPLHWCLERLGISPDRMDRAVKVFERTHTERIDLGIRFLRYPENSWMQIRRTIYG